MNLKTPLFIGTIALLAPLVFADESSIDLQADEASYNHKSGTSTYRGNVEITSDNITLKGDEVEVFTDEGNVTRVIATANPSRFTQRDGDNVLEAEAQRIEYHLVKEIINLSGNVRILDKDKTFTGENIVYNVDKRIFTAKKQKERVRLTLQRNKKKKK